MESTLAILSGNAHPTFVKAVCKALDLRLAEIHPYSQMNGEIQIGVHESVRGRDVYIIQSFNVHGSVNSDLMEALLLTYHCTTAAAKSVTLILPYMPYSTQSRMHGRSGMALSVVARSLEKSGVTRIVSVDLYRKELQGFFQVPIENLRASPFLIRAIQENIKDHRNAIILAADTHALALATAFSERLSLEVGRISGALESDIMPDGRMSPPPERGAASYEIYPNQLPKALPKHKVPLFIEGDVGGRIAIMVDIILDSSRRHVEASKLLKQRGAYKIYLIAIHGLLAGDAAELIEDSPIDEVYVTNTVPHELQKFRSHKIRTVDVSPLISEAIRRINNCESLGALFANVSVAE